MKAHFIALILFILLSLAASAQADREDVIYLKNGSIYRGTIIEQIPGVSYKIEIAGGSVIVIKAEDVEKITKEAKTAGEYSGPYYNEPRLRPKPVYEYKFRPKGYFFQAQVELQALEMGFRLVNGYKFGRFGYLGLGLGLDGMILDIYGHTNYSGVYFPFYVHYGGTILKTQISPFYSIEAGYAFHPYSVLSPQNFFGNGSNIVNTQGGLMGGVGLGVKFCSKRRVHFDLSAHLDLKQSSATIQTYTYDQNGNPLYHTYNDHTILIIPGMRFGIGF